LVKEGKFFFFYDTKYISSNLFTPVDFMTKIKKFKFAKENLVITFDINGEIENIKNIAKNIIKLKDSGLKVAVMNFTGQTRELSLLPEFQPDYIFLDKKIINHNLSKEEKDLIKNIIDISHTIESDIIVSGIKS